MARHGPASNPGRLQVADLVLDPASHEVYRGPLQVNLTPTEYRLLEFLMSRAGRVVSRAVILEAVWGWDREVEHNTLEVFIKSLRDKVDSIKNKRLIHTIRGFGYSLREPVDGKN
jgi:DNA-binding response OmpR family regulator